MTAARALLPLELDATSERELDMLKQKVERRGSPEEEVGAWSDHCLLHEESFTDKRHNTIKNKITDALQMGTALIMVPADGSFATAIAKDKHKEGEIQGTDQAAFEVDQHLGSETHPHLREQDRVRRCRLYARKVL